MITVSDHLLEDVSDVELPKHDEDFWMDDGNLVLLAGRVAFKVYRGLLATQSPIFADMFSSADAGASDKCEGCPVVEMQDSPEDLRHLLRILLPKQRRVVYTLYTAESFTFHQLSSLVRLGHKYQIDDILTQALAALQRYFAPTTFEDLERVAEFDSSNEEGIELVNLARLTDTPDMLPIAFYICIHLGSKVIDGWRREDGSVVHLSTEDLKRCIEGIEEVAVRRGPMTERILDAGPSPKCKTPAACSAGIQDRYRGVVPSIRLITGWTDVIRDESWPHICNSCSHMLQARAAAERRAFWKDLTTIFRL